jgi:hypothetical protein
MFLNNKTREFVGALILIGMGIGLRLLPHPANFTPLIAITLFGGVYLSKKTAYLLPITIMTISNLFIENYFNLPMMISVYGSLFLMFPLSFWIKRNKDWKTIGGGALLSGIIFFLVTNFSVWLFTPWYQNTLSGLINCFVRALPFFRGTLMGNLFYVPILFGGYELIKQAKEESFFFVGLKKLK